MSKPNIRKRTLQEERRVFNVEWELQFYVVAVKDKMMCLLCNCMIRTVKKYNANQHYTTHKNHKYVALKGEARKEALKKMKLHNQQQRQVFQSVSRQGTNITEATYRIAYILGKKGKPYSDAELIKYCIIEAVSCLDSDRVYKYKKLPLSRRIITDRQHELALSVSEQLYALCQNEDVCYSIALDEATDINDSAQVLFFIRLITLDFQCFEELLGLGTLSERIRGIDVLNLFKEKFCKINLNLTLLLPREKRKKMSVRWQREKLS